jgi:hypothetical protein
MSASIRATFTGLTMAIALFNATQKKDIVYWTIVVFLAIEESSKTFKGYLMPTAILWHLINLSAMYISRMEPSEESLHNWFIVLMTLISVIANRSTITLIVILLSF